jgi:hypothetical protein
MRPRHLRPLLLLLLLLLPACARQSVLFSEANARAHVQMLAGTIGNRPAGTPANERARAYIVDQLKLYGFDVRVQQADARRAELGRTARVSNIIAVRPGARREAIGLVSHYDSSPDAPGATDDGLGVAVSLEAARVLAARGDRQWSLMVLVTDGEEAGLMGAAALMTDREVAGRLQAYLNLESVGSSGPAMLFEAGPRNAWITRPWARRAPHPRGGSLASEVYRRLPNDTDFSVIKRQEIPGLNFASIGDSYAYHTARDTPDRLSPRMTRELGENVVAIATALDAADITQRSASDATYLDLGGASGLAYGPRTAILLALLALVSGVLAWVRVTSSALRMAGALRWTVSALWALLGSVAVVAAMIAATWALRLSREFYHPWYARPDRLFLLLLSVGASVGWGMARAGRYLPSRWHPLRHPVTTWSLTLPVWIVLSTAVLWLAPAAGYLLVLPLLVAGIVLSVTPSSSVPAMRAASALILAAAGAVWITDTIDLLRFMVPMFGRLPIITPVFAYAVVIGMAGSMLVPPFLATVVGSRPLLRPSILTVLLLLSVAVTGAMAYVAPAYTYEQPLRRVVRALQERDGSSATWEVGSSEPGLDLAAGAPPGWTVATDAAPATVPWGRLLLPFVFRTTGMPLGPAPAVVGSVNVRAVAGGAELSLNVAPREPGLTAAFVLPEGVTPVRSSLPGVRRSGRWTAIYVGVPAEGVTLEASFRDASPERLRETRVAVTARGFPGGGGWQRLPDWIPQERAVWSATATWVVPAATDTAIAPVPPLR